MLALLALGETWEVAGDRAAAGFGMGTLQILRHDGNGHLTVEGRPFVVMADDAMVDLGTVGEKALKSR